MTNPTTESLLARYAKCDERLKGTGAPGLPDVIVVLSSGVHIKFSPFRTVRALETNRATRIAVSIFVMWAMDVAGWADIDRQIICDLEMPILVEIKELRQWWGSFVVTEATALIHIEGDSKEEAWCCTLESICDAVTGGG